MGHFSAPPPQEGGQSGQGQGGASGFRHLGEKHGGIGLKIHGHGRVVQNAVVQEFDVVQAGRYLCQGECVIGCSRDVHDDRICGEPLKRQGGVFPQNKRGQVRGSVQDKAASRLNGYGERPAQGIQRGAGLVDGGNMGEVTQGSLDRKSTRLNSSH